MSVSPTLRRRTVRSRWTERDGLRHDDENGGRCAEAVEMALADVPIELGAKRV